MDARGVTGIELLVALAVAGVLTAVVALTAVDKIDIERPPSTGRLPVYVPAK